MKKILLFPLFFLFSALLFAQQWGGGNFKGMAEKMKVGHFYGKIIDSTSGTPMELVSVQLIGNMYDTLTKTVKKNVVIAGQLTKENGDFSLEKINVMGKYTLKIVALGYATKEFPVAFSFDMEKMKKDAQNAGQGGGTGGMMSALNAVDKDLGNILIKPSSTVLKAAEIDVTAPVMELKLDKKVFNVEKNMVTAGGTAEDVLKQVPTVNVDIDGNVSMRNASPQIFVDGRPSTLTIDQIPADAIEKVELITNPSAKYDASGGGGGIINIVLKQNKKMGYFGDVRAGVDMRGKANFGGDVNARQGKVNLFLMAHAMQRKNISQGTTLRDNLFGSPLTNIKQSEHDTMNGYFTFLRGGMDYFIDNRNTITLTGMTGIGSFNTNSNIHTQTDTMNGESSSYNRISTSPRTFNMLGTSLQYKHNFPKPDKELTADANYNHVLSGSTGDFHTQYFDMNSNPVGYDIWQKQTGSTGTQFLTLQTDFTDPINDKTKIEMGGRAALRNFTSKIENSLQDPLNGDFVLLNNSSTNYIFNDQVYAGYVTFSQEFKKFSYQMGLREESSFYQGELVDSSKKFYNQYPVSLFPSAFATYHLNSKSDLQLSYSRKINRPTFMNLIPYTNYSDSLNLTRGNPDLKPEFTHLLELNYLYNFNNNDNMLFTLYGRETQGLITSYQENEYDDVLQKYAIINTYENANYAYAYGVELTVRKTVKKWFDVTANFNGYNSVINGTNLSPDLTNQQLSWFGKLIATIKFPKNISLQLSGSYWSKTALQQNSGGGRWGGFGGGGPTSTVQGYMLPHYDVDAALKYEFLKNKAAAISLSMADVFMSNYSKTSSTTDFFTQTTSRLRDWQFVRLNFSYRFGKMDVSIFKRKNTNVNTDGMDMGGGAQ